MNANRVDAPSNLAGGVKYRLLQVAFIIGIQAVVVLLAAGRLDYLPGWAFVGLYLVATLVNYTLFLRHNPELIAERGRVRAGTKSWDRVLAPLVSLVGPLATLAVAGLDVRFAWSAPLAPGVMVAGALLFTAGFLFVGWSMSANRFFAGTVRIQTERGHVVASTGPYGYVRHPGYVGMSVMALGTPMLLGSAWAFAPGLATVALFVLRTMLEDSALRRELPGYESFAQRVRYRLLPFVW